MNLGTTRVYRRLIKKGDLAARTPRSRTARRDDTMKGRLRSAAGEPAVMRGICPQEVSRWPFDLLACEHAVQTDHGDPAAGPSVVAVW